jgi:hypothetical protein
MQSEPTVVAPYCGERQQRSIPVPARIAYRQEWEEGPWAMIPYAWLYPEVPNSQAEAVSPVPPPVSKTDLWRAQQTYPL